MSKNNPTIEETQAAYLEVYKEECSTDEAMCIIHDFVKYRAFADRVDFPNEGEHFDDPKTIGSFVESRKHREDRKRDHEEYESDLKKMTPKQRWLHMEGFDNPLGEWVEKYMETDAGCELFIGVCQIWTDAYPHQLEKVLNGLLEYAKKDPPPGIETIPETIKEFMETKEAEYILRWFLGICNDGGRASRTIHNCARAFFLHKWETFQVLETRVKTESEE